VGPLVVGLRLYVIRRRKFREIEECLEKILGELGLKPQEVRRGTYQQLSSKNLWIS
jgi:hypothetical protein